ncbi:sulfatase-like hydrolase/transferase [Natrinema salaciae]|uniref:Arylsulfatase A n=1 Tax=Natrinema salaciae TaxID=1186196 RepID=A0A1H9S131_9EURY|nr:sulfatase-like hydrolase/transferase [Natrinema salaciae]SER78756.1 Arylsulfatase A [Natrinema salaciae]
MNSNILLIILDSTRARNTSLHGHDNRTTPFLEEFAESATVYEQARAPSIHSIASHVSIFTGHHVEEHRLTEHESNIDPSHTIWDSLSTEYGHRTGLFTPNTVLTHASNLADCFETVDAASVTGDKSTSSDRLFTDAFDPVDRATREGIAGNLRRCVEDDFPVRSFANCVNRLYQDYKEGDDFDRQIEPAFGYADSFLEWSSDCDGPWAACLNFFDSHYPYYPLEEYDRWGGDRLRELHDSLSGAIAPEFLSDRPWGELRALEALYDGGILQADQAVKYIVEALEERGDLDDTLVVVTSDHGEGFGERSLVEPGVRMADHSWGIHEVLTHVPLVVKYPGQQTARRYSDVVSLTEFPEAVTASMNENWIGDPFVTDEPVVASTYRLLERQAEKHADCENIDAHLGPWRAVYEQGTADVVTKFVRRQDSTATIEIETAQASTLVAADDGGRVQEVFDTFEPVSLTDDEAVGQASAAVEERLADLGYMR